jgi:hypothetical protein
VEWYATEGHRLRTDVALYERAHREKVMLPNCEAAGPVVSELRARSLIAIDPTAFSPAGWTQPEFREFWALVIRRFACEVRFVDGWEYSDGCAYECLVACEEGLRMTTAAGVLRREEPTSGWRWLIVRAEEPYEQLTWEKWAGGACVESGALPSPFPAAVLRERAAQMGPTAAARGLGNGRIRPNVKVPL